MQKILKKFIHFIYNATHQAYGFLNKFILPRRFQLSPLVLRIRITNKCNLHCSFCYLAGNLNTGEENVLSLDEWKKIIDRLPSWTIIDITGAEPTLANNFYEILSYLLDKKFKVSLITNGLRVDERLTQLLVKKKLMYLMISIDGPKDFHNSVRGSNKSLQNIESFISKVKTLKKDLNSTYPIICAKTTITSENFQYLNDTNDFVFNQLGVDIQSFNLMFQNQARGGTSFIEDLNSKQLRQGNTHTYSGKKIQQIKTSVRELVNYAKLNNRAINFKPEISLKNLEKYIERPSAFGVKKCFRTNSIATLYFDGTLSPCDIAFDVANIRDLNYDMRKIWYTEKFKKFSLFFKQNSPYSPICEGCCLAKQVRKR